MIRIYKMEPLVYADWAANHKIAWKLARGALVLTITACHHTKKAGEPLPSIEELTAEMRTPDKDVRYEAMAELAIMSKNKSAVPLLITALLDPEADVRWVATKGIESFGPRPRRDRPVDGSFCAIRVPPSARGAGLEHDGPGRAAIAFRPNRRLARSGTGGPRRSPTRDHRDSRGPEVPKFENQVRRQSIGHNPCAAFMRHAERAGYTEHCDLFPPRHPLFAAILAPRRDSRACCCLSARA